MTGSGRALQALLVAAFASALGCTSYVGAPSLAPDATTDASLADVPVTDTANASDVQSGGACGPPGMCDPITGAGCAGGGTCGLGEDGTPACSERAAVPVFASCTTTSRCAPGLSCVGARCVRLCCGDDACDDLSNATARSRCAVKTSVEGLYACTRPGGCDYVLQNGCPEGQYCSPTSLHGGGNCLPVGTVAGGAACRFTNECERPFTCVGAPGVCRRTCSLLRGDCPGGAPCLRFSDRPADYGYCES